MEVIGVVGLAPNCGHAFEEHAHLMVPCPSCAWRDVASLGPALHRGVRHAYGPRQILRADSAGASDDDANHGESDSARAYRSTGRNGAAKRSSSEIHDRTPR